MKYKKIIDSWNKIEPDEAAQERMLLNVLGYYVKPTLFARKKKRMNKKKIWEYAVSIAVVAVVAVGSLIIVPTLSGNQQDINVVENPVNTTSSDNIPFEDGNTKNEIIKNRIITQQEFGVVSLSTRSPAEVNNLALMTGVPLEKTNEVVCYEDDMYIYYFYDDGTSAGIMAKYLIDSDYDPAFVWQEQQLLEEDALVLAKIALLKYCESYTEETEDRFKVEIWHAEENGLNHYPEWRLIFTEYTPSGIRRNFLSVGIDAYGNVAEVTFGIRSDFTDEELDAIETIDREQAVSIAIEQLEKEGQIIKIEDFVVTSELFDFKETLWWDITFDEKTKIAGEFPRSYGYSINAVTGEPMEDT